MTKLLIMLSLVVLATVPVTTSALDKTEVPEVTVEGLRLVPGTNDIAYVWAVPGISLSQYKHVYLLEPAVAFRQNWKRDQNRGSPSGLRVTVNDMDRIRAGVKELFLDVFTKELEAGGYSLANERAEDVLIVRPAILNLDVNAPDIQRAGARASMATSAGSMTLYMELIDSESDFLLAKAMDPTSDRESHMLQWQTGAANRQAARLLMEPWAKALRNVLDEARNVTGQE
jgi:hypothetical protein